MSVQKSSVYEGKGQRELTERQQKRKKTQCLLKTEEPVVREGAGGISATDDGTPAPTGDEQDGSKPRAAALLPGAGRAEPESESLKNTLKD